MEQTFKDILKTEVKCNISIPVILDKNGKISKVLLGLKKEGKPPIVGKYTVFGGHKRPTETEVDGMKREFTEESKLEAKEWKMVGFLRWFLHEGKIWKLVSSPIYIITSFEGKEGETNEMKPKWFNIDEIPYLETWADTKIWMPVILSGFKVKGDFWYSRKDSNLLIKVDFNILKER